MSPFTLIVLVMHVFAAILFVGAATVSASVFPMYLRMHWGIEGRTVGPGGGRDQAFTLTALHRITRRYGTLALTVPLLGLVLASLRNRLGEGWLNISLILAAVAAVLLIRVVRVQEEQLRLVRDGGPEAQVPAGAPAAVRRLLTFAGLFNLVWLMILILMVWRPGGHA